MCKILAHLSCKSIKSVSTINFVVVHGGGSMLELFCVLRVIMSNNSF